jgi:hypothetical protein
MQRQILNMMLQQIFIMQHHKLFSCSKTIKLKHREIYSLYSCSIYDNLLGNRFFYL